MTKSEIRDTLSREIEYRKALINQAESGVLLHLDTPEKVIAWVDRQEDLIGEVRFIASKLHVNL